MPSCFGSRALSHFQSRICSDMTVRDRVLLTLGFSARAGSYPARLDRTAARMWLTASQGVCYTHGKTLSLPPEAIAWMSYCPRGD